MIVQFATVQLWSAIIGTRPGVLLPQDTSSPGNPVLGKRKRDNTFQSRPEGADGTKFFMHGDYRLAYCPIAQITAFAFHDGAFANTDLTLELIWRLRVSRGIPSLPLRWKPEVLNVPFLRCIERTPYGYGLDGSLPMTYDSNRHALKELGRDARFEDDVGQYNFRRWTANEVNSMLHAERDMMDPCSLL
ncbi:FluG domain-containing protein [Penicillium digitatum]|uniref:FluG domain-containing protein n=1 Tax=Penicillium digitatum TaxID=36651 RepID=A0A7T7BI24_PENDI|nr:FluG domain-containing protein [Penicillium digitatum]